MAAVTRLGLYGGPRAPYAGFVAALPTATLSGTLLTATEADIRAGGQTLIITMTNDTWVASPDFQEIIDRISAPLFPATGWNTEVRDKAAPGEWVRTSDTVITWTLAAQAGYDIEVDETGITATIPHTELTITTDDLEPTATPTVTITVFTPPVAAAATGGWDERKAKYYRDMDRRPRRSVLSLERPTAVVLPEQASAVVQRSQDALSLAELMRLERRLLELRQESAVEREQIAELARLRRARIAAMLFIASA